MQMKDSIETLRKMQDETRCTMLDCINRINRLTTEQTAKSWNYNDMWLHHLRHALGEIGAYRERLVALDKAIFALEQRAKNE